jgi:hypothetical protein
MTIDASVLSLFPTSSDTSSTLLGIIYGGTTSSSGGDPLVALRDAETNQTKDVAVVAAEPQVSRDIAAFKAAVASAKTPADLLNNPQALKVLLTANGLGDQTDYTALAQKALLSNTTDPKALANTLSNTEWKTTAQTYDFANKGLSIIKDPATLDAIANGYAQVQWETSLDQTTPGLSSALDFRSRAGTIKSVDQVLGDPTFRTVVTTALGIPQQIAFQPLEAQEKAISSQLDVTKFKDPAFVENFTKQYLIANAQNNASTTSSSSTGLLSLFA